MAFVDARKPDIPQFLLANLKNSHITCTIHSDQISLINVIFATSIDIEHRNKDFFHPVETGLRSGWNTWPCCIIVHYHMSSSDDIMFLDEETATKTKELTDCSACIYKHNIYLSVIGRIRISCGIS